LCGIAAALAHIASSPDSAVPVVGASGAIGGVMGAYAVLYPRAPVHMLVTLGFYFTRIVVPAYLMLGYWFLLQILGGLPSLHGAGSGVAFWAHVGGFAAGIALLPVFRDPARVEAHRRLVAAHFRAAS
jgi:membrane associated rhomboid family serine protease